MTVASMLEPWTIWQHLSDSSRIKSTQVLSTFDTEKQSSVICVLYASLSFRRDRMKAKRSAAIDTALAPLCTSLAALHRAQLAGTAAPRAAALRSNHGKA